jgi:hypothetical protein
MIRWIFSDLSKADWVSNWRYLVHSRFSECFGKILRSAQHGWLIEISSHWWTNYLHSDINQIKGNLLFMFMSMSMISLRTICTLYRLQRWHEMLSRITDFASCFSRLFPRRCYFRISMYFKDWNTNWWLNRFKISELRGVCHRSINTLEQITPISVDDAFETTFWHCLSAFLSFDASIISLLLESQHRKSEIRNQITRWFYKWIRESVVLCFSNSLRSFTNLITWKRNLFPSSRQLSWQLRQIECSFSNCESIIDCYHIIISTWW